MTSQACSNTRAREASTPSRGLVLNVMRFALHDGPGIRTTVFLKGCPLHCWWCHNPESQSSKPEVIYVADRCIRCGDCVLACPQNALHLSEEVVRDLRSCQRGAQCADACPTGAQQLLGSWKSVPAVMAEILKDRTFFDESGGGVTISGGEPLLQADFAEALLAACGAQRIHTALDTCGYTEWRKLDRIRRLADLILFDLKVMDPARHLQFTGAGNKPILENLIRLSECGTAVVVRIPVIPGVNDDEDNLTSVSRFLSPLGLRNIDLLPYHRIASGKYSRLGMPYRMEGLCPPGAERMQAIADRLQQEGFHVHIGGSS